MAVVKKLVELLVSVVDVPLCLDSANPAVLAAGLAAAPGKPLVNSVSGEEKQAGDSLAAGQGARRGCHRSDHGR